MGCFSREEAKQVTPRERENRFFTQRRKLWPRKRPATATTLTGSSGAKSLVLSLLKVAVVGVAVVVAVLVGVLVGAGCRY